MLLSYLFVVFSVFSLGSTVNIQDIDQINSHRYFAGKIEEYVKNNANVSELCSVSLRQYAEGLLAAQWWALKMFDSSSKLPSGLLDGGLIDLGLFDECLNTDGIINTPENNQLQVFGRYCLGTIMLVNPQQKNIPHIKKRNPFDGQNHRTAEMLSAVGLQLATCLPHTCSPGEIQDLYNGLGVNMIINKELCQTKTEQPELDSPAIATISVLGVFLWIIIASTAYDIVLYYTQSKPAHSLLIAFSVFTNGRKLMKVNKSQSQISCLHGIRVISTMWVILGHRFSISNGLPIKNLFDSIEWMFDEDNMFIIGAPVSVDTFFVLGGIVLAYSFLSSMQKGMKFNIILYYLHRYLRLTPLLAIVILINITLFKYMGSGPIYRNTVQTQLVTPCEVNWWKALLYFQNYGNTDDGICIPQSWYLSVDMQLFLISPLILLPFIKFPMLALLLTGALAVASIISCFVIAWVYELNGMLTGNLLSIDKLNDYMSLYYAATHTRAAPWLIGILVGYFLFKISQRPTKVKLNWIFVLFMWAVSLAVLCTCVFAGLNLAKGEYDRVANSFYIALVRPAWGAACSWVVLACVLGYGGPINWFLSLPVFQVFSKLTYSLYLVHYNVIYLNSATMRVVPWISNGELLYVYWGDLAFTVAGAVVLTLAFEAPMITIEKFIFRTDEVKKTTPKETKVDLQNVEIGGIPPTGQSVKKSDVIEEYSNYELPDSKVTATDGQTLNGNLKSEVTN